MQTLEHFSQLIIWSMFLFFLYGEHVLNPAAFQYEFTFFNSPSLFCQLPKIPEIF